ncbi:MAG: adenosylmethionine decarboxylase [Actinomycetales bacterium]|nr:adenosylmethionine decarboxylase [Actinomycetales bacterium]
MPLVPAPSLGRHVVADVEQCFHPLLDDAAGLELLLRDAAVAAGSTVLSGHHHRFEPHGATALCVLAESHISIHTWPELGAASLDAYTCGDQADPVLAVDHVLRVLAPRVVRQVLLARGGDSLVATPVPWLAVTGG